MHPMCCTVRNESETLSEGRDQTEEYLSFVIV